MKIIEKVLCGLYLISGGMYLFDIIYCKDISKISTLIWVINTVIMFACARTNEKRADKFEKLYFDGIEKDIEQKVDKFMKEIKNESI